jgi:hypothetical protein
VTNKIPENPDFDTPHVVLKHDRANSRKCKTPYFIGPLCLYSGSPHRNPAIKLFGVYPSLNAALAAVQADSRYPGRAVLGERP